tara:strand:+ start:411 stop:563 length:153 start_codon:yes stop_codon:yes gene_type:complete
MKSARAQKCGGVQRKINENIRMLSIDIPEVATAQPIMGGKAPAAPPITMF